MHSSFRAPTIMENLEYSGNLSILKIQLKGFELSLCLLWIGEISTYSGQKKRTQVFCLTYTMCKVMVCSADFVSVSSARWLE